MFFYFYAGKMDVVAFAVMKYEKKYGTFPGNTINVKEPGHVHKLIAASNKRKRNCAECGDLTVWTDNGDSICSDECTAKHCKVRPGHRY